MRRQHHKADHLARHALLQQIMDGEEVAQALGHLLALHLQHFVMQPDIGEFIPRAAALRDLVLVVREHQVIAAAMDIEMHAQQFLRHGRAFDVPAGTAPAPRAVPTGQITIRRLPQDKIHRIFFVGCDLYPRARDHIINRTPRKLTVVGIFAYTKQRVSVLFIGKAIRDQLFDHRNHLGDVPGRTRLVVGAKCTQRIHILMIPAYRLIRTARDQLFQRTLDTRRFALLCGFVDAVVHIGEIAHIGHVIRPVYVAQQTVEHIEHDDRARIAQMGAVIDRRAADIHPYVLRINRREILALAALGVVQSDRCHGECPVGAVLRGTWHSFRRNKTT